MPMTTFRYRMTVIDGRGETWDVAGTTEATDVRAAVDFALRAQYTALTGGDTTFGHPGEGGCCGPYTVTRLDVSRDE